MGKIATEIEARTIGDSGSAETGRMCTKARAIALGCKLAIDYADNQLVQYEHLSKNKVVNSIILRDTGSNYEVEAVATFSVFSEVTISVKRGNSSLSGKLLIAPDTIVSYNKFKGGGIPLAVMTAVSPLEDSSYIYSIGRE